MRDGGPAYPTPTEYTSEGYIRRQGGSGMSLLDYFAGKALVGLLSNPNFHWDLSKAYTPEEAVVERAFDVAKAAVVYRSKPNA